MFGDAAVGGLDFGGRDDDWSVGAVEFDDMEWRWVFGMEELVGLFEAGDLDAIDFVDGEAGEVAELAGDRVAFDASEDDDVLLFLK